MHYLCSLQQPQAFPSYLLSRLPGFELIGGWRWRTSFWDDEEGFHAPVPAVCSCIFKSHGFSNDQKLVSSWSPAILQEFHL